MPPEARWAGCEPGSGSPRRLHDHLVRRPLLLSFSKAAFARTMFEAAASARSPGPRCHSSRPRTGSLTPRPQTCQEKLTTALVTTSVFYADDDAPQCVATADEDMSIWTREAGDHCP